MAAARQYRSLRHARVQFVAFLNLHVRSRSRDLIASKTLFSGAFRVQLRPKNEEFKRTFEGGKPVKQTASTGFMERAMGIEPTSEAWEALNKTLKAIDLAALNFMSEVLNWKLDGN
jgi:hypothetical protein